MSDSAAHTTAWDYLIRGAKVFDGKGNLPVREDIAVTDGRIAARAPELDPAMDDGYAGFSTDALPFHYLANQPNTRKTIPTQFARYYEIKRLTDVVRRKGGIWQATPPKDSTIGTIRTFLLSCGRLHGKPLKTTVVAALDVHSNRRIVRLARLLARVLNSRLLEGDFVLAMLRAFDRDISWYTVSANRDEGQVRKLLMDRQLLPGFNDSGTHLTNMAFYDGNLRALKLASDGGDTDVAYMVRRLTSDPARVFGVKGGSINVGDQADLILIDPSALRRMDHNNTVKRQYREEFQHEQLVNRTDGVVPLVMIAGHVAWNGDDFDPGLGKTRMGTVLDTTF